MAEAVVEAVDAFCTARAKPSGEPVVAKKSEKHEPVAAAKTPEKQKPDKKADGGPRQRAAAESGTWSFLRNFRMLSSAHARNREAAEK
jgi:hypothetical protein